MSDVRAAAGAMEMGEREKERAKQTEGNANEGSHMHRSSVWDPLRKIGSWLRRDEERGDGNANCGGRGDSGSGGGGGGTSGAPPLQHQKPDHRQDKEKERDKEQEKPHLGLLHRRSSRRAVPGLPRPLTFKRMNSEKRDRLVPVEETYGNAGAGTGAGTRPRATSRPAAPSRALSPPPITAPSVSAPNVLDTDTRQRPNLSPTIGGSYDSNIPAGARQVDYEELDPKEIARPPVPSPRAERLRPPSIAGGGSYYASSRLSQRSASPSSFDEALLQEELEAKWILNLSMHFRDRSDREKFFITFAEEPTRWRRVTVSCDYRDLTSDSLEADLKSLHYQRDKSARIYEAVRDSLPAIQFYPTVTNLKLQTADGRLHVHVTEDVNEIIAYPSLSAIAHLGRVRQFSEEAVSFDSHISGFVYKVRVHDRGFIKKEIPGPDAVEEFLYEINALCALQESQSVIRFEGVIVDESRDLIKGLLISYAERGALVDIIYDFRNSEYLSWERRERWARQIVQGLSEIHEAGFVQGDFTLSNIVVDRDENAKIIDINRRGCPVGWEPPELAKLIDSGQRISIYIGVKSDLFQLGMVLWALAEQQDEPERQERPLYDYFENRHSIPAYYRGIVEACLSESPRHRLSASELLKRFPEHTLARSESPDAFRLNISIHRPNEDKEYIDPSTAVDLEDISTSKHSDTYSHSRQRPRSRSPFSSIQMPSTEYINSSSSYIVPHSQFGFRSRPSSRYPRYRARSRDSDTSTRRTNSHSQLLRSGYSSYPANTDRAHSTLSLDDSELDIDNELPSLPASRGTRWEQVYEDGDTKLVQRGGVNVDIENGGGGGGRGFDKKDVVDVCITTPPPGDVEVSITPPPMEMQTHCEEEKDREEYEGNHPVVEEQKREAPPRTPPQVNINFEADNPDHSSIPSKPPYRPTTPPAQSSPFPPAAPPGTHTNPPQLTKPDVTPPMQHSPFSTKPTNSSPRHIKPPSSKASFSERIRRATPTEDSHLSSHSHSHSHSRSHSTLSNHLDSLAALEQEVSMVKSGTSTAAPPSRTGTGFSELFRPPMHQDSGFYDHEAGGFGGEIGMERVSFENERIRQSLDGLGCVKEEESGERDRGKEVIEGRLWYESEGTMISEPREQEEEKERASSGTMRPMSLTIPEFHHHVVVEKEGPEGRYRGYEHTQAKEKDEGQVFGLRHVYGHIS